MNPRAATFVAHALSLAALHGPGPWPRSGYPLPDDDPAAGAVILPSVVHDGVSTHHFRPESQPVSELADLILARLDEPARLLDALAELQAVRIADDLVRELRSRPVSREKLRLAARFVVEHATRREVAKLGIVLLGVSGDERDGELLQLLGSLEEFALFAVVALMNTQPDPQRKVFELARRLDGWGRIHAVERLRGCADPDIRAWLLRDGFRNGVMNEYLAHLAATTGGLYEALLEPDIDDALLDGAADILRALEMGGPAEDMRDYEDAVPVMHRFGELLDTAEPTLGRLDAALSLRRLITRDSFPWPEGEPARLAARYEALTGQRRWRDLVRRTLVSRGESAAPPDSDAESRAASRYSANVALSCARRLEMRVWEEAVACLRSDRHNPYIWQWLLHSDGRADVERVAALAAELLPLGELASGPSESLGLSSEYDADMCLELVVRKLSDHPGIGAELIPVALANRVVRCRRAALTVCQEWPPETRPPEVVALVRAAADHETNADLRAEMLAFPPS
ncbi:hypothetical protein [Nocardia sp. NPDC024068]|uniref:hypothetical protein n=1 Tax=Nocardia sp. NPDC024068 TaxID=3157197 RepID=UPI003404E26B